MIPVPVHVLIPALIPTPVSITIPITAADANLLLTWVALILLATYELVSEYRSASIHLDRRRLRAIAIAAALLFVAVLLARSYLIVTSFRVA